ncbi:uncharacterized protein LOC111245624 isoform X1 [Varroa destructor]|uniref:Uncharacterized protein n=1 Tax=Varroa destructor TaxID=109461 RepID=A0A7M7JCG2_VARDE|nr:uncharacterized protein LOC111245624 isoform X1 [Varroa destructor]
MESEHRQASEDSLTSATESDLVAKVNKLSSVLLGTNSNVTVLNQRLIEYQRSHETALEEIRRSVNSAITRNDHVLDSGVSLSRTRQNVEKESTPRIGRVHDNSVTSGSRCCANPYTCYNDKSPINTLVGLLGEKDTSLTSLHREVVSLRGELDRTKAELRRVNDERVRDKGNADTFRKTVHTHLKHNIDLVNRLLEHSSNLPTSVKRALVSHSLQEDFVVQQAELSSKLEWLVSYVHRDGSKDSHGLAERK